ncbi:MAG: glycosyltransferase family 39 protein [Verrucomicrobiota bacterium]
MFQFRAADWQAQNSNRIDTEVRHPYGRPAVMQPNAPTHPIAPLLPAVARDWRPWAAIGLLGAALFTLRVLGPPNLLDQDQENPATYVLDVVKNGNWICQRDLDGNISSKPPFFTWMSSLVTLATGRLSLFSLYLPGAAAWTATALLVFAFARTHFGVRAGFYGAVACLLCTAGLKAVGLARTDAVFAFWVTTGAFLAYRAWVHGNGWTWFWLAAAFGTLTKGPLAVVLSSAGLLAVVWERRSGSSLRLRGSHQLGVLWFVVLTVGWLSLALWSLGRAVVDKMIMQELVFHAAHGTRKGFPGSQFYVSPLYYLARAAPWSAVAYYGLWRIWRRPSADLIERRFERFLFCWFVVGLLIFSFSPHQRGDLLWPIVPAAALIAGAELARLTSGIDGRKLQRISAAVFFITLLGFAFYFLGPRRAHQMARQTLAVRAVASEIEKRGGKEFPLTHTDDPPGLQVYLNTYRPPVSMERACAILRGRETAFVAVTSPQLLEAFRQTNDPPLYTLGESRGPVDRLQACVIGNRPTLGLQGPVAFGVGPWTVRYEGQLMEASNSHLVFSVRTQPTHLKVANESSQPETLLMRFVGLSEVKELTETISPGATWTGAISF